MATKLLATHPADSDLLRTPPDIWDLALKAAARLRRNVATERGADTRYSAHDEVEYIIDTEIDAVSRALRDFLSDIADELDRAID